MQGLRHGQPDEPAAGALKMLNVTEPRHSLTLANGGVYMGFLIPDCLRLARPYLDRLLRFTAYSRSPFYRTGSVIDERCRLRAIVAQIYSTAKQRYGCRRYRRIDIGQTVLRLERPVGRIGYYAHSAPHDGFYQSV